MKVLLFVFSLLLVPAVFAQFNYEQGSVTLKNGTILYGDVANIKHGFRDKLLDGVRIKTNGKILAKKYRPRQISGYTIGDRQFVSWRVQRSNSIFQESYTVNAGNEYLIFELYRTGHVAILLAYFTDDDMWIQSTPYLMKENDVLIVRATQGVLGLKRKLLADYFRECPELVELIRDKKITTPTQVAIFYNNWKEEKLNPQ